VSYSFRILNGDLDLSSNTFGVCTGIEKLTQDLSLWIKEEYGIDRFHPDYGSTTESFIGDIASELNQHELEVEVVRVLNIYQQIQLLDVQKNPGKFTLDELLNTIESVNCTVNYDSIDIKVVFTTASGLVGTVSGGVSL
jgi:phage baseplate assembly protein W